MSYVWNPEKFQIGSFHQLEKPTRDLEKHIPQVFLSTAFYLLFDTNREFSYNMHVSWG